MAWRRVKGLGQVAVDIINNLRSDPAGSVQAISGQWAVFRHTALARRPRFRTR